MDISTLFTSLADTLGAYLPKLAGGIGILIVGWLLAVIVRTGIRKTLSMMKLNNRISSGDKGHTLDLESGIAQGAFWLIILMTFIAVLNALDLELVSRPLESLATKVFEYLPQLIAGSVLLLVAWLIASVARMLVNKGMAASNIDEKLSETAGMRPMSENIGNILYWLIMLLFLPAILDAFKLEGLLEPVRGMVDKILNMLPNMIAAAVIGLAGWLIAKILRDLVTNILASTGADRLGVRAGLTESMSLSRFIGMMVFVFVFVPALIAALNALKIEAISQPATEMLGMMMGAIPNIIAAAIILIVSYYVARFVANISSNLLSGLGVDAIPEKIGFGNALAGDNSLSRLVGRLILFFAMLFATVEAANRLEFSQVRDIVSMFIEFGGQVLLGSVILIVGYWLSNLADSGIRKLGGRNAQSTAMIARIAILGLVTAMGLRAMGIANDIVNLGFALTLGSVAVAVALSFGLGGREAAGRQMEYWLSNLRDKNKS
ncbi:MAG: mechanosensitive ion channel [Sedimenticola sp.]